MRRSHVPSTKKVDLELKDNFRSLKKSSVSGDETGIRLDSHESQSQSSSNQNHLLVRQMKDSLTLLCDVNNNLAKFGDEQMLRHSTTDLRNIKRVDMPRMSRSCGNFQRKSLQDLISVMRTQLDMIETRIAQDDLSRTEFRVQNQSKYSEWTKNSDLKATLRETPNQESFQLLVKSILDRLNLTEKTLLEHDYRLKQLTSEPQTGNDPGQEQSCEISVSEELIDPNKDQNYETLWTDSMPNPEPEDTISQSQVQVDLVWQPKTQNSSLVCREMAHEPATIEPNQRTQIWENQNVENSGFETDKTPFKTWDLTRQEWFGSKLKSVQGNLKWLMLV